MIFQSIVLYSITLYTYKNRLVIVLVDRARSTSIMTSYG